MVEILEINRIEELADFRTAWHELLARTRGASFFQTLEWLEVYWKHYGRREKLRVLMVLEDGKPLGIVPLVVTREQTRLGKLRTLTYPLHDWGSFYGPIGPDSTATLTLAMQHIAHSRRDWELLDFRFVERDGIDVTRTPAALEAAGLDAYESPWKQAAMLDLAGGWDAYWASRDGKFRNNLRRYQKRFAELGEVEHVRYRPRGEAHGETDPRWDLYDACVAVARRSWQGQSPTGTTLSHDSVRDFLRETHAVAARLGCLDLNLIKVNGEPIAFGYNYIYNGALVGLRIGYDPKFAKAGVGNVLYLLTFEDSFRRGDTQFDMGVGSLEMKRWWWTRTVQSYRYTHYPLSAPRAQLLRLKHWLFGSRVRDEVPLAEMHVAG
jgi:CelD/BcsL family acetyltransferase involved in cellulose biosynthesis